MTARNGAGAALAVAAAAFLLTGCGGAVTSVPRAPAIAVASPVVARRGSLNVKLTIPGPARAGSSRRRKPRYVSRSTQGIGVTYRVSSTGGPAAPFPSPLTPPASFDVSAGSSACSTLGDGGRACSFTLAPPAGTDDLEIDAWDARPVEGSFGGANRLSSATLLGRAIAATQNTTLSVTLDGIVNAVVLAVTPNTLTASDTGSVQPATLAIDALDADGNVILGDGTFVDAAGDPLTISVSQAAVGPGSPLRTTLATAPLTPASSTLAVTYIGGPTSGTRFSATTNPPLAQSPTGVTLGVAPRAVISEFALPSGSAPLAIIAGPDGDLWTTEYGTGSAGAVASLSTAGVISATVSLPGNFPEPKYITTGPDGNLWFTRRPKRIDRLTPGGSLTEFTTGITSNPYGITVGPDGNLWFAQTGDDTIGRISTNGTVATFSSGISAGAQPWELTTDGGGNLWFTESGLDRIGRITTAGVVTEFAGGITPGAVVLGITTGPDGAIWFCEVGGGKIGRLDPSSGAVTEYPIGGSGPREITVGPDGALWFTESQSDSIGRIDTSGTLTEYSTGITPGSGPVGIARGPDGNIWFTEFNRDALARLVF